MMKLCCWKDGVASFLYDAEISGPCQIHSVRLLLQGCG